MDLTLAIVLLVFLVLFFVTVLFGLYVWWKKSVYTREKFAFAGLATVSTLTGFILVSIYAQQPPWLAVIGLLKQWLGLPYEPPQPLTTEQEILSLLLLGGFLWFILRLHRQWNSANGAQSIEQYRREQSQQPPSLLGESWLYLRSFRNPDLLAIHKPDAKFRHSGLTYPEDSLAWHEQARDLLHLSSKSYEFLDEEWHDQKQCWIGKHKRTGDTVVLACWEDKLDETTLQRLMDYVRKVRQRHSLENDGLEFIVALKDGDVDEQTEIDGHRLRFVSESRLLDGLVDFSGYFRELRNRVERDKLAESELTIGDMYTISSFTLEKDGESQPNLEAFLHQWLDDPGQRQLALLGEYGQGKSTASLMLSYGLMQRIQTHGVRAARIPILLELRGKSPRNLREDELLSTWAGRYNIHSRALLKLLVAGRLLTIFEGFDEVDLSGDADARIEHFKVMWGLCYPKAKVLITGRPNYFFDEAELKTALGIHEPSLVSPYCQAVYLAPFGSKEIEHSLRKLDADSREGIIALADENDRFYEIVSRPSLLHVVSVLWRKGELEQYRDRINSAIVMDLFIRHSYERQRGKGRQYDFAAPNVGTAKPVFMRLNTHERAYFMEGIAAYMLVNGLPNQISSRQLDDAVRLLIDAIPDAVSLKADAQSGENRKPLRERFDLKNKLAEAAEDIQTDVRACGLLVSDLSRGNSFKFGHKSFMEFLAGKVFAQWSLRKELEDAEAAIANSLVNKLGLKMRHVVQQPEVMAFTVEWIAEKAKNHVEAARLLFLLIFGVHSPSGICWSFMLKLGLRILSHTQKTDFSNVNLFRIGALLPFGFLCLLLLPIITTITIENHFNSSAILNEVKSSNLGIYSIYGLIFINIYMTSIEFTISAKKSIELEVALAILGIFALKPLFKPNTNTIETIFLISLIILISFTIILLSIALGLTLGRWKKRANPTWIKFRAWCAICKAAHLQRQAMVRIIGEKALTLLEGEAKKERRPWTMAESLEKL